MDRFALANGRAHRTPSGTPAFIFTGLPGADFDLLTRALRAELTQSVDRISDPVVKLDLFEARERRGHDLLRLPLRCKRRCRVEFVLLAPRLGDVGQEAAGRDRVDPDLGPVLEGEGLGDGVERRLAGIGRDLRGRSAPALEMLMIEPPSPAAMRLPTSDIRRNGP